MQAVHRVCAERIFEDCGVQLDDAHWPSEAGLQSPREYLFHLVGDRLLLVHRRTYRHAGRSTKTCWEAQKATLSALGNPCPSAACNSVDCINSVVPSSCSHRIGNPNFTHLQAHYSPLYRLILKYAILGGPVFPAILEVPSFPADGGKSPKDSSKVCHLLYVLNIKVLPGPAHNRPVDSKVSLFKVSKVSGWNTPASHLPIERQKSNSGVAVSDSYVPCGEVAMDQSLGHSVTEPFHLAPARFQDITLRDNRFQHKQVITTQCGIGELGDSSLGCIARQLQVLQVVVGSPIGQANSCSNMHCRCVHEAQPPRSKSAMLPNAEPKHLCTRILKEQPTEFVIRLFYKPIATQTRNG